MESDEGGGAIQRCGQTGKGGIQGHGQTPVRSKLQPEVGEDSAKKSHCGPFSPNMSALKRDTSQLEGPTPANSYGFKISQSGLCASHNIHEVGVSTTAGPQGNNPFFLFSFWTCAGSVPYQPVCGGSCAHTREIETGSRI